MYRTFFILLIFCYSLVAQERTVGVISLDPANDYESYTLYAPLLGTDTYLINNCGQVINTWSTEYTPGTAAYLDDEANLWRAGVKRSNNEFQHSGTGGIIQKISWDNILLWEAEIAGAHHDFLIMPNGHLLVTLWEKLDSSFLVSHGYDGGTSRDFWAEAVLEIEAVGSDDYEVVWEWHIKDHLVQTYDSLALNYTIDPIPRRIDINYSSEDGADWLHMNSIDYDPLKDQILLSCRNFNELWIIDHSTTIDEASTSVGGKYGYGGDLLYRWGNDDAFLMDGETFLDGQHDARFLGDKISLFNNGRMSGESRPLIITPHLASDNSYALEEKFSAEVDSSYFALRDEIEIDSPILSSFEILSNGNVLICAGQDTRIYELEQDGTLVWEYRGTVSLFGPIEQGSDVLGSTFNVTKYATDDLRFANLDVSIIQQSIEVNPLNDNCELSNIENHETDQSAAYYYSSGSLLKRENIDNEFTNPIVSIYNSSGQLILRDDAAAEKIDISHFSDGFYIYTIQSGDSRSTDIFVKN